MWSSSAHAKYALPFFLLPVSVPDCAAAQGN
jgi:hypothetical protein